MTESVAAGEGPVRPGLAADGAHQRPPSCEFAAPGLDGLGVLIQCGGDRRRVKHRACGTGNLERLALGGRQSFQLQLDQTTQILRNRSSDVLERTAELPPAAPLDQHAACDQIVGDVDDEQRIAFREPVDRLRQGGRLRPGERLAAELSRQILSDLCSSESAEPHQTAMLGNPDLGQQSNQRMLRGQSFGGAQRAHDQEPGGLRGPRDEAEPVQCRCITPVQVLQPQDQRDLGGDDGDCVGQLAQHALAGATDRPSPEHFELGILQKRGQLRQPAGRMPAQDVQQACTLCAAAEARDCTEQWQIGFARAVMLGTAPDAVNDSAARRVPLGECIEQCRLPDAGLTAHEHELCSPQHRLFQAALEHREFGKAPHHARRGRGKRRCGRGRLASIAGFRGRTRYLRPPRPVGRSELQQSPDRVDESLRTFAFWH